MTAMAIRCTPRINEEYTKQKAKLRLVQSVHAIVYRAGGDESK